MPAIWEIKRNWSTYWLWKTFVITEDMVSISTDSTKWVAPYNESYWYTNITIDDTKWIVRMSWAVYSFFCNSSRVASAYRNVRVRIWTSWTRYPVFTSSTSILWWHSYFVATQTRMFVFKTTTNAVWLHMTNDTTYSALTVANITSSNTSARVVSWSIFNQWVNELAIVKSKSSWQTITNTDTASTTPLSLTSKATTWSCYIAMNWKDWFLASFWVDKYKTPQFYNWSSHTLAYISDTAYANSWNWITDTAPSQNAVYDKISAMDTTISWKADSSAIPTKVSQLTNDSWYTSNTWTITWITMNGSSKWTSGVVDLWTVITDVSWKANTSDVLTKTNTTAYTPTANYHPTTKKYVDDAIASAWWWNMECLTTFWTKWRFWTKAMFNALTNKDVNGVYVILSQRDYNKMIQD